MKRIKVFKNAHGTSDVVVYADSALILHDARNFFRGLDIWQSIGYDRFNDGGLYFEVPEFVYSVINEIPFVCANGFEVEFF